MLHERVQRRGVGAAWLHAFGETGKGCLAGGPVEVAGEERLARPEPHPLDLRDGQASALEPSLVVAHHDLVAAVERDLAVRSRPWIGDEASDLAHGATSFQLATLPRRTFP